MGAQAIAVTPWLERGKRRNCFGFILWKPRGTKRGWFWLSCLAKRFPKTEAAEAIRFRVYAKRPKGQKGKYFWFGNKFGESECSGGILLDPVASFIRKHRHLSAMLSDGKSHRLYIICETRGDVQETGK